MNHKTVERYALSVFEQLMTVNDREVDRFVDDAGSFIELLSKSPEMKEFFSSPAFSEQEKKEFFETVCDRMDLSAHFRSLYALLIEHRRTLLLAEIRRTVSKYHDAASGISEAVIFTPFSFDEGELGMIAESLAVMTGNRKIRLVQKIDPLLVGGAQIRIGDRVYDASLKSMMKNLKKNIMEIC